MKTREAIFISHATPEGNAFTLWLGAKLFSVLDTLGSEIRHHPLQWKQTWFCPAG